MKLSFISVLASLTRSCRVHALSRMAALIRIQPHAQTHVHRTHNRTPHTIHECYRCRWLSKGNRHRGPTVVGEMLFSFRLEIRQIFHEGNLNRWTIGNRVETPLGVEGAHIDLKFMWNVKGRPGWRVLSLLLNFIDVDKSSGGESLSSPACWWWFRGLLNWFKPAGIPIPPKSTNEKTSFYKYINIIT